MSYSGPMKIKHLLSVGFAFVAVASVALAAADLTPEFKTFLDTECAKTAKEKKDAPCNGVANVVWFKVMMNPKLNEQAKKNPDIGKAATAYCAEVCEAARK